MIKPPLFLAALALVTSAGAQPAAPAASAPAAPAEPAAIAFKTVAEAKGSLEARDGNGTIVTHPDGWVVVNEPEASAQWSFVPAGHYAHPAVVRRVIQRARGGAVSVHVKALCDAPQEACARLVTEFEGLNDRIVQSVRARSRQGSTPR
ncbi:molecular chaperone DnaJ [Ideonella sp. A 288]|uniref:molecular chaperone DnaJ n=1 Tax=Ideonella sp. A 288 TaxID=1962181 RepID=UPI000B4B5141|nr:molecular chaperone DnaJ [Ideonella sp. A 288]